MAKIAGITGAGQIIIGAVMFPRKNSNFNESAKALSMINIGLGTTTLILSSWNSIQNNKPKTKLTSWNIQTVPQTRDKLGLTLGFTKYF